MVVIGHNIKTNRPMASQQSLDGKMYFVYQSLFNIDGEEKCWFPKNKGKIAVRYTYEDACNAALDNVLLYLTHPKVKVMKESDIPNFPECLIDEGSLNEESLIINYNLDCLFAEGSNYIGVSFATNEKPNKLYYRLLNKIYPAEGKYVLLYRRGFQLGDQKEYTMLSDDYFEVLGSSNDFENILSNISLNAQSLGPNVKSKINKSKGIYSFENLDTGEIVTYEVITIPDKNWSSKNLKEVKIELGAVK